MGDEAVLIGRTALVLFGALVIQVGLLDDLQIFGVHPELLLVVAVGTGVAWGASRGAIVGFIAGLLSELFLAGRLGVVGLSFALAAFGVGLISENLARQSRLVDAGLVAAGSGAGILLYALISTLFGQNFLGDDQLWKILAIVSATSAVLSPLVLPVCRWAGTANHRVQPSR